MALTPNFDLPLPPDSIYVADAAKMIRDSNTIVDNALGLQNERMADAEQAAKDAAALVNAPAGDAVIAALSEGGVAHNLLVDAFTAEVAISSQNWKAKYGTRVVLPTHQPDSDDGQVVHPSVVFVPEGVAGYKYWMAYTPYAGGNDAYEDPCVIASVNGATWELPDGIPFPMDDAPGGAQFNSDTNIVYHDGELYVFWRYADTSSSVYKITIYMRKSSDGVNWSSKQKVHEESMNSRRLMAPSFEYFDGKWHLWAVDNASPNRPLVYMTATTLGVGNWSTPVVCSLPVQEDYDRWHINIKRHGGQLVGIMNDTRKGGNGGREANIYLISSFDGKVWSKGSSPLVPRIGPEHNTMYAATFVVLQGSIEIWYSAIQQNPAPGTWYVYKTTAVQTLPNAPHAAISGLALAAADVPAGGGKQTVNIEFPPGLFTAPPIVTALTNNGRVSVSLSSTPVNVNGAELNLFNFTTGDAARPRVHWIAIQP